MDRIKCAIVLVLVLALAIAVATAPPLVDGVEAQNTNQRARPPRQRAPRLTLGQAVSIALNRNLRMSDARLAIREEESKRRSAFSDFFPALDLSYTAIADKYRQSGTVAGFMVAHDARKPFNPQVANPLSPHNYPYRIDPYRTFTLSATLTQPVYTGGKLLNNYKYYRLGVDYSELDYAVERQDLILEVYEAYYQMMKAEKLLDVANQSILALESLRNQTLEFYKAGVVPKVDVLSTEGQLASARIQRTQSLTNIATYRADLNNLLRYPQDVALQIVQDYDQQPNQYEPPGIYNTAVTNRLEIRQANISMAQALALVRAAEADLIPQVQLQLQGSRTNDDWNPFDPEAINDWKIQGLLSWGFNMFRTREEVRENRALQGRAFVNREQEVENILKNVQQAYLNMKESEANIADNRKAVIFRRENFRINQERYKEQVATYTEVLDAQRELAQAQGDYFTSLINYRINTAILEREMGVLR